MQQYPHSLVNGISNSCIGTNTSTSTNGISSSSSRLRNWPDLTENMSTLDICDNDHDNEHDHDNDYIVQQQSSDDEQQQQSDDNEDKHNDDSLIDKHERLKNDRLNDHYLLLSKCNNLKNADFTKRHSFTTVFANNDYKHYNDDDHHNDHDSHDHQHHHHNHSHHNNNLSRDSSSGSCNNINTNNQLFLLDTAPSLKLSNLMVSS